MSEFGAEWGSHEGVWECPDLFKMVTDQGDVKWCLLVSINPGAPNGGSGTQYFIGDFDGIRFQLDADFMQQLKEEKSVWLDYGRDNYAGVTWSNIPDEQTNRIFIGWMSNWDYAQVVPTKLWRSTMTIPRKLSLTKSGNIWKIKSWPTKEMNNLYLDTVNQSIVNLNS